MIDIEAIRERALRTRLARARIARRQISGRREVLDRRAIRKALALWFALDRWMDYQAHESEFRRQDFVLLNRYTLSNVVYQGARVEENADRYALIEWINKLEHQIFGLPHPDLYLVFDVPAQLAFENNRRKGVREYTDSLDVYEADASLQEQVRQLYRSFANDKVKVIRCYDGNAMLSPDAIFEQVLETLQQTEVLVCSEDLEVGLLRAKLYEMQKKQRLYTETVRRAYQLWKGKHPDSELCPDAAELVVWLMEQVEALEAAR